MRLKVNSQKLPLSHARTASSVLQQAAPEMHSLKTYPFCPVYDFPPPTAVTSTSKGDSDIT